MAEATAPLLGRDAVRLGLAATGRAEVVREAGRVLVEIGAVEPAYADAMHEREAMVSSYVGEGFALPHGTNDARQFVRRPAFVFLQYPDGVDWDGQTARVAIAIAAAEDEHMTVMATLAQILLDPDAAERLRTTADPDEVLALLAPDHA